MFVYPRTIDKRCHSEPVRRLAWESVLQRKADCHTSDIGHWFAMTEEARKAVCFSSSTTACAAVPLPQGGRFLDCAGQKPSPLGKVAFAKQMTEEDRQSVFPLPPPLARRSPFPKGEGYGFVQTKSLPLWGRWHGEAMTDEAKTQHLILTEAQSYAILNTHYIMCEGVS